LDEGLESMLQLTTTRISKNFQLPFEGAMFNSHDLQGFFQVFASTGVQLYLQMVNQTRTSKTNDEF
jgi:hypothetical protein